MNDQTDQELLRNYVERKSDSAFAALVERYVDLIHSAALRMSGNSHVAKDITQCVFVALSRNAGQLTDRPTLAGWLHNTARNLAAKEIRSEIRRRTREQEAAAMNELLTADPAANWEEVAPHLDAALSELSEPERDAVLLRYFKNEDLRTVGATFGISDDAAQKRVSRAVERLRELFAKRGVTVGASGLIVVISANAVQAAPVGLAITICTAAALTGTALTTATATVATKAIVMTALQKTVVAATVAALAGFGFYEARQASQLRQQVQTLQQAVPMMASSNEAALVALQQRTDLLAAQNSQLTDALAKANADKAQLEKQRQSAQRSAALFKELAERANASNEGATNEFPSERHAMVAMGKLARRFAELKQPSAGELSPGETAARATMQMAMLGDALKLFKAMKQFDDNTPAGTKSNPTDQLACVLYGALNLDARQFTEVYSLVQKYAEQKERLEQHSGPEPDTAFNQLMEQAKLELKGVVRPEQAMLFDSMTPYLQVSRNKFGVNFNVDEIGKPTATAR